MPKKTSIFMLALIVTLLELSLTANLRLAGFAPHLVVVLLVGLVVAGVPTTLYWQVALTVGVVLDLFSTGHFGLTALSFMLTAVAVYTARHYTVRQISNLALILYVVIGSVTLDTALSVVHHVASVDLVWFIVGDAAYTLLLAVIIWALQAGMSKPPSSSNLSVLERHQ